jgi:citronellol/citronellal dehydrogenase
MAKFGMSLCVLGMAEEYRRDGIAFNALWPKTAIQTAAIQLIAPAFMRRARRAEIVADAAHVILTTDSRSCTGNFFLDEQVLRDAGVTDFSRYRDEDVAEEELMGDFFI